MPGRPTEAPGTARSAPVALGPAPAATTAPGGAGTLPYDALVLLLLPPSEGKTAPRRGDPLDLDALLGAPGLTAPRERLIEELASLGAGPEAARVLGLGPRSTEEAALNTVLRTAPAAPAHALYTGVLYQGAGLHALARRKAVKRVLADEVVILSGLWGALRATDAVPDHRLSMGVTLSGAGRLASFWKPFLTPVLSGLAEASDGVVVDCRSGAYSPAWQPAAADGVALARVQVVQEAPDGRLTTVSHWAKHTRGLLTGVILDRRARAPRSLRSVEDVAELAAGLDAVGAVELRPADRAGRRDLVLHLA